MRICRKCDKLYGDKTDKCPLCGSMLQTALSEDVNYVPAQTEAEKEEGSLLSNKMDRPRNYDASVMVSPGTYNLIIGTVLLYAFLVNYFECLYLTEWVMTLEPLHLIIGYFVCCLGGVFLSKKSDNPLVSFIGFNLVALPVGLVISPVVMVYEAGSVMTVCMLTGGVVVVMTALSSIFPQFFAKLGKVLFFTLLALVIVDLLWIFFGSGAYPTILDIGAALLFSLYIGYDWYKAQTVECFTVDAAVDACVALYLDIVNLFLRLLRIFGRRK